MSLNAIANLFSGIKKFRPVPLQIRSTNSDIFDGWDVFVRDSISDLRKRDGVFNYDESRDSLVYEAELASMIAGEVYRRKGVHSDLATLVQLERQASGHIDYPRQLAYLVFKYEEELTGSAQMPSITGIALA